MRRGEDGRFNGLFKRLRIEFGDANGLPGGLGELLGECDKIASIGVIRLGPPPTGDAVGDARNDTSSTCSCVGSKGCGFGLSVTRPLDPGLRGASGLGKGEE